MNQPTHYEDTVRQMVRHENELANHRVTWLLTFEGLLFTALSFAWDKQETHYLVYVLCAVGMAIAGSCWPILDGAQRALGRLRQWWIDHRPPDYAGPDVIGFWRDGRLNDYVLPTRIFPLAFILAWFAVGVINYTRPPVQPNTTITTQKP
jgi:hypothetical protein